MAIVTRQALVIREAICWKYKPSTTPDAIPSGLRYVTKVCEDGRSFCDFELSLGCDSKKPSWTWDLIPITLDDADIEVLEEGKKAYRESDGAIIDLEEKFWRPPVLKEPV